MTHLDAFPLLDTCKRFLCSLPLPVHLRNYLVQVTRIVPARNPTVAELLRDDSRYDTIQELRDQARGPCECAHTARHLGIPLVDGHLFIRHPALLRKIFGSHAKLLLQHRNNDVCPTWSTVRRTVVKTLRTCALLQKVLPEKVDSTEVQGLYTDILHMANRCWKGQHITAPRYAWE